MAVMLQPICIMCHNNLYIFTPNVFQFSNSPNSLLGNFLVQMNTQCMPFSVAPRSDRLFACQQSDIMACISAQVDPILRIDSTQKIEVTRDMSRTINYVDRSIAK